MPCIGYWCPENQAATSSDIEIENGFMRISGRVQIDSSILLWYNILSCNEAGEFHVTFIWPS